MSQLLNGQTAFDRPDATAAVFKSRLDQMKMNIRHGKYFDGREAIYVTIESKLATLFHYRTTFLLDC